MSNDGYGAYLAKTDATCHDGVLRRKKNVSEFFGRLLSKDDKYTDVKKEK